MSSIDSHIAIVSLVQPNSEGQVLLQNMLVVQFVKECERFVIRNGACLIVSGSDRGKLAFHSLVPAAMRPEPWVSGGCHDPFFQSEVNKAEVRQLQQKRSGRAP